MHHLRIRLRVAEDGTITGHVPDGVPAGEHDADVILRPPQRAPFPPAGARDAIRALQDELARLPVLDPRTPEQIVGYNEHGLFD